MDMSKDFWPFLSFLKCDRGLEMKERGSIGIEDLEGESTMQDRGLRRIYVTLYNRGLRKEQVLKDRGLRRTEDLKGQKS